VALWTRAASIRRRCAVDEMEIEYLCFEDETFTAYDGGLLYNVARMLPAMFALF
jgi:hypothetical protein